MLAHAKMTLKRRISDDMKDAMRARDAARLSAIRLLLAAIRQREIDERVDLNDADVVGVVERLIKQRRDASSQFEAAGRLDLAQAERFEAELLTGYLPPALADAELDLVIAQAIAESGANGPSDMGKVMAILKARMSGRAQMGAVSARVKAALQNR